MNWGRAEGYQKLAIFAVLIGLVMLNGCGGIKSLKHSSETPTLHDGYKVETNKRLYIVLPLPDGIDKEAAYFNIERQPSKGDIWLTDRTVGFSYYTPKSGRHGYDYLIYSVSSGNKTAIKKIQFNIED